MSSFFGSSVFRIAGNYKDSSRDLTTPNTPVAYENAATFVLGSNLPLYDDTLVLAVSAPATIDLNALTDMYGATVNFAKVEALVIVNKGEIATPPLGILFFRNAEAGNDVGAMMAAAVVVVAPLVIAFLMAQRRFIEGITMGSYK